MTNLNKIIKTPVRRCAVREKLDLVDSFAEMFEEYYMDNITSKDVSEQLSRMRVRIKEGRPYKY